MSYAAEAIVSAAPPPSKPTASKSAPQPARGDEPSFDDHLATETVEPAEAPTPTSMARESAGREDTASTEAAPGDEAPTETESGETPALAPAPTPTPTPIGAPVLVQLIAQTNADTAIEDTPPVQAAAPTAPDAPVEPARAPTPTPPVRETAPAPEMPVDAPTFAPVDAKPQGEAKADATPTVDARPQEKTLAPNTATPTPPPIAETPAVAPQPEVQTQPVVATRPEATDVTPQQQPVAAAQAPTPTRATKTQANTETSEGEDAPSSAQIAAAPAPVEGKAPAPVLARAAPMEADTHPRQAEDEPSVQEKFTAALERSSSRGEAKTNVERAPAVNQQTVTADVTPAPANSAAPESMSSTAHVNAISATTTHAAAQTQALSADHLSRAAPASTQVSQEIVRRFNGDSTKFELRLDPPELGRVEVRLEVTRDHKVTAVVSADSPQALTELARHARDLEQSLQSAGLELSDNGLSFDLRQSREDAQDARGEGGRGGNDGDDDEISEQTAPLARPIGLERWRGSRVDVMA